ncbi:hypothetical protein ATN00_17805 [Sphingobium baderi]|uniref:Uncharacterized protein n=1 Tax=Sphingobium baderi TaxID=1332080 RepID=A0A0S3F2R7_9SPHN|nr:hypothetical protein ATN00_17805 [Sphingobium baderi]
MDVPLGDEARRPSKAAGIAPATAVKGKGNGGDALSPTDRASVFIPGLSLNPPERRTGKTSS